MKTVASTLGVARSNLIERRDKVIQARGPYRKAEDAGLLLPSGPSSTSDLPTAIAGSGLS
jgi:hypothetical protein